MSGTATPVRLGERLRDAVAFLTPFTRSADRPTPEAMVFFPVVGAGLGVMTGSIWWLARRSLAALPASVVAVTADAVLTGALHLDGLADTADGLLAHVPAKDRLAIMSEPEVGTFGTVALEIALVARAAAFATVEPSPLLLAALWSCSRSLMALGSRSLPYAWEEGLASAFLPTDGETDGVLPAGIAGLCGSALLAYCTHGRRGLAGVLAGSAAGAALLYSAHRRIGGFTGDVLGAAGVTCETVALVVVARR